MQIFYIDCQANWVSVCRSSEVFYMEPQPYSDTHYLGFPPKKGAAVGRGVYQITPPSNPLSPTTCQILISF